MQPNATAVAQQAHRYRDIDVLPFGAALGAEVRCGDLRRASAAQIAQIRQAWLDHLVLVFRGQTLSDPELLALARHFGELDDTARPQPTDQPGQDLQTRALTIVSNVIENGKPIGALSNVDLVWHTDMSYIEVPPDASILYAVEVPAAGGETGFCNMYRALETLPREMRTRLQGATIKHDATHNSGGFLRKGFDPPADVTRSPGPSHPAIRTHPETGCDALFLGRRPYSYVQGLPVPESEALLEQLWSHAAKPDLAWYHKWRAGDVVMWDNRCTMHRRNAFDNNARRIMHRTQIKGTRPYAAVNAGRAQVHPRGLTN
ncbi:MAG: TauD/TfdA family dioxygenase [Betaproteobacteria bacterium]|nr:TauD/TfdA family dioxygenase [Betaproteobacteria bacterium]